jgi:hypothetical protein
MMEMKSTLTTLQPGMYILRHPKGGLPPLTIGRAPGGSGQFETLSTPGVQGAVLRDGSDCIVMHVFGGSVELLVTAYVGLGSTTPSLRLDQIGLDVASLPQPQPEMTPAPIALPTGKPLEISANGISIVGHIERVGDEVAGEGATLGQVGSNSRLEGFQLMWPDKPDGVELSYGVTLEGTEPLPMVGLGNFCGTRNMARRVTEVSFALLGPKAKLFSLEGVAYFSGGFRTPIVSGMALRGPSGMEHLTAISLRAVSAATVPAGKNLWDESPQTKVFKAATEPKRASLKQPATTKSAAASPAAKKTSKAASVFKAAPELKHASPKQTATKKRAAATPVPKKTGKAASRAK